MPEKKRKVKLGRKNLAMLLTYFDYVYFCATKTKNTSQARIKPEIL